MKAKQFFLSHVLCLALLTSEAQVNPMYTNLPVGKYRVGFRIITFTDPSRVIRAERDYLGEKNEGDRSRTITMHVWYPAQSSTGRQLTYGDYCYNALQTSTHEKIGDDQKSAQIRARRNSVEGWFGKCTDEAWKSLTESKMLAYAEAPPHAGKFPLLIGILRSLSTSMTNEMMASNGYVVAMVTARNSSSFATAALGDVPDMQMALHYLEENSLVEAGNTGVYGFSGSGFTPVLFGMHDVRVKALADIESGIYMDGLYEDISASDYYNPAKLRIPFLHIFSRDLSKQEKYLRDFERKTKFSQRYRLVLNQPSLHHWDFASEGYTSCLLLNNRGTERGNIMKAYEIASTYLLNFFNAMLKGDKQALTFLNNKPILPATPATAWDIYSFEKVERAPDAEEFEYIVRKKGIRMAKKIASERIKQDSSSNLWQGFIVNRLGYTFLGEKKYDEAIGVFQFNTELHPADANFEDSLTEAYEASGDNENMTRSAKRVLELLDGKAALTDQEKAVKANAERRMKTKS